MLLVKITVKIKPRFQNWSFCWLVLQWLNLAFLNSLLLSVLLALVANLGDRDLARDVQSAVAVFDMGDMSSCPGRHCGEGGITSISKKSYSYSCCPDIRPAHFGDGIGTHRFSICFQIEHISFIML